jgi:hypothetical protein
MELCAGPKYHLSHAKHNNVHRNPSTSLLILRHYRQMNDLIYQTRGAAVVRATAMRAPVSSSSSRSHWKCQLCAQMVSNLPAPRPHHVRGHPLRSVPASIPMTCLWNLRGTEGTRQERKWCVVGRAVCLMLTSGPTETDRMERPCVCTVLIPVAYPPPKKHHR